MDTSATATISQIQSAGVRLNPTKAPLLDARHVRQHFPVLQQEIRGRPLVYLDNAASTQKPQSVIDALVRFYQEEYASIHRGVYALSEQATAAYEEVRRKVQRFIGARCAEEIVFTRGATESINLVASSFGEKWIGEGDEIIITEMEHHSNIIPWQRLCQQKGARLKVVPFDDTGTLEMAAFERLFSPRTKMVAVVHVSNALGTVNPVKPICDLAHRHGVPVLVDGAQSVQHMPVDVEEMGCDFFVFSGHKLYGPTGIGVLYGKRDYLDDMPPYQGGGGMIRSVTFSETTYADSPEKFEAGTPNVAGAIGLGAAIDYVEGIGRDRVEAYGAELLAYGTRALSKIPKLRLIGTAKEKASILSFVVPGLHPHDLGTILDSRGVAIRVGHHCAQPIMEHFGIPATARASLAFYNTPEDIDALVRGIDRAMEMFDACPISPTYTKK